jgi:hypothetical protein
MFRYILIYFTKSGRIGATGSAGCFLPLHRRIPGRGDHIPVQPRSGLAPSFFEKPALAVGADSDVAGRSTASP